MKIWDARSNGRRLQAVAESKGRLDREMRLQGRSISEEEFERLMERHRSQQEALEQESEAEKLRMRRVLEQRVNTIQNNAIRYNPVFTLWLVLSPLANFTEN